MRNSTMNLSEKPYLHHCSFRSEKNFRTGDKLITLIKKVCCQLSPFLNVRVRGDPSTNQIKICLKNGNQVATWKTSESGFSLKDKKSKFLRKSDLRSRSTNFKPIPGCDQSTRDQLLLQEELSEQNRALRETRIRNMRDMEELQKSHVLKVEELSRKKLTEDQNTTMELRARFQELQNEVICMNGSRDFKDAVSTQWTIPRSQSTSGSSTLSWSRWIAKPQ